MDLCAYGTWPTFLKLRSLFLCVSGQILCSWHCCRSLTCEKVCAVRWNVVLVSFRIYVCHAFVGHADINTAHWERIHSSQTFMAEWLFALSIGSRCELSGREGKNRAGEVRETRRGRASVDERPDRGTGMSVRKTDRQEVKKVCFF